MLSAGLLSAQYKARLCPHHNYPIARVGLGREVARRGPAARRLDVIRRECTGTRLASVRRMKAKVGQIEETQKAILRVPSSGESGGGSGLSAAHAT
jgi:hypothetical protein